jgi:prefoldin subunit 5
MGAWPVPDEIKDMAKSMEKLVALTQAQNNLLEKLTAEIAEMRTRMDEMQGLGGKVDSLHGTLTTAKDALRMMSTLMERKL